MTYQPSIRLRLTVWYAVALAAALSLFGAGLWFAMRASLLADLNATLADRAHNAALFLERETAAYPTARMAAQMREELDEFSQGLPLGVAIEIRDAEGKPYYGSSAPEPGARVHTELTTIQNRTYELRVTGSTASIRHTLDLLRLLLLASTPVIVLIASCGGYWLSRRALRPVDAIVSAAQNIGIENLSERLQVPPTGDELQRLSETWNGMLARLETAVKRLSQFTADASHELRTPLAVIRATAEIAARKPRPPEAYRTALEQVVTESGRMTQLVDDLLFLARYDAGAELPSAHLDLSAIAAEACDAIAPLAAGKNIRILQSLEPFSVEGNELALRRLVLVLLDNAIKYSHAGADVQIEVNRTGLTVSDSGQGIAEQALPHIFERFYQADPARADRGYGLGLAQARTIADRHGATVQVASQAGQGSSFQVIFPTAQQPALSVKRDSITSRS